VARCRFEWAILDSHQEPIEQESPRETESPGPSNDSEGGEIAIGVLREFAELAKMVRYRRVGGKPGERGALTCFGPWVWFAACID